MGHSKNVDWEAVSREYRAGIRSLRDIGDEYGITEGAIRKRAKAEQWPRDLSEKIQAKAKDLVRKDLVRSGTIGTKEKDVIDNNAAAVADIMRSHIVGVAKLQTVCDALTAELVAQSTTKEDLRQVAELFALVQTQDGEEPDAAEVEKKLNAFMKTLNLGNRAETFKKLVEAKTRLITLERTAFDLDKGAGKNQSLGEFLESLT